MLVVLIITIVLIITKPFGKKTPAAASPTPTPAPTAQADATDSTDSADRASTLAQMLGDQDSNIQGLTADQLTQVDDLSINQSLPSDWMNILLLGSDERSLTESARTDSMIICSINMQTGQVKLTSIMRDLAVYFGNLGSNSATYRINAANYFGGERLAMKTVNECFGMNIDKYVRVNFYGFQQIAQMLGGIDIDITEAEMEEINYRIQEQWYEAMQEGVDESTLPNELLTTYGANTHLDGRRRSPTPASAIWTAATMRCAERQRKVLGLLLQKLDGKGSAELISIGLEAMKHMTTNLSIDEIVSVALKVLSSDHSNIDSFRLPINNSYKQETRNNQDMLYDCDWSSNASSLYTFIYG